MTYGEAPSHTTEAVIVGLKPGKAYQFHVATVSAERMLVPGSSIVSDPVRLPEAKYEKAWFFEGGEDDIKWAAFEGLGPESVGPTGAEGGGAAGSSTALDDIRLERRLSFDNLCSSKSNTRISWNTSSAVTFCCADMRAKTSFLSS